MLWLIQAVCRHWLGTIYRRKPSSTQIILACILAQCCGTVMICMLLFRFRLWNSFGTGSASGSDSSSGCGSRQYLAQFSNNDKFVQNLAFSMSEEALFPRKLASHLWFFDFLNSILRYIRIQIRFRNWNFNAFRFRFRSGKKLWFLRFHWRVLYDLAGNSNIYYFSNMFSP